MVFEYMYVLMRIKLFMYGNAFIYPYIYIYIYGICRIIQTVLYAYIQT